MGLARRLPRLVLATLGRAAGGLVDLVLPPRCLPAARRWTTAGTLCAPCWRGIAFLGEPCCACCGLPFAYAVGEGSAVRRLHGAPPAFARARAVMRYDEDSRGACPRLQAWRPAPLAPAFGRWMRRAGAELLAEADLLMPVPLHWTRLFARRYNQAAVLAHAIRARRRAAGRGDWLLRRRRTPSQGKRNAAAARRNVARRLRRSARRGRGQAASCWSTTSSPPAPRSPNARGSCAAPGPPRVDVLTLARAVRRRDPGLAGNRRCPHIGGGVNASGGDDGEGRDLHHHVLRLLRAGQEPAADARASRIEKIDMIEQPDRRDEMIERAGGRTTRAADLHQRRAYRRLATSCRRSTAPASSTPLLGRRRPGVSRASRPPASSSTSARERRRPISRRPTRLVRARPRRRRRSHHDAGSQRHDRARPRAALRQGADRGDHPMLAAFRDAGAETGAWLLLGSMPSSCRGPRRCANRSFLFGPDGEIAARYDKIHMFDVDLPNGESYRESPAFRPGDSARGRPTALGRARPDRLLRSALRPSLSRAGAGGRRLPRHAGRLHRADRPRPLACADARPRDRDRLLRLRAGARPASMPRAAAPTAIR